MKLLESKYIGLFLVGCLVILINVISSTLNKQVDLTSDGRYTLHDQTKAVVKQVEDVMLVKVYLEGADFPIGFRRLQDQVRLMLKDFKRINPKVEYIFEDPLDVPSKELNARMEQLGKDGMDPVRLSVDQGASSSMRSIFPYAVVHFGSRMNVINLLEAQAPGQDQDIVLNNSAALLEYKFASAFNRIVRYRKPNVAFLTGHGELERIQLSAFERELRKFYNTAQFRLDSLFKISSEIDVVVIAKPRTSFSDRDKFILDQYLMNGGSLLLAIDKLNVELDSLATNPVYIPFEHPLNLDDMFFRYGFRINDDLALDLESSQIPLQIGMKGNQPDYKLFPWFYHPLIGARVEHPITKGLDRINLQFVNTIDTVRTATAVSKYPLLRTSPYSRIQRTPVRLGFGMAHEKPDPSIFTKNGLVTGMLLEGQFSSLFKNRVTNEMRQTLSQIGSEFKEMSDSAKIIVIADGDILRNEVNSRTGEVSQLGFNRFQNILFNGNKDFMVNAISYLESDSHIMDSRSKEMKLRLLDRVRTDKESLKWQVINIALPFVLFIVFGVFYNWYRKKKYTS